MDTANMSPASDSDNSSDDLINELARLMAADARGPESAPKPAEPAAKPAAPVQERTMGGSPSSTRSWADDLIARRPREGEQQTVAPEPTMPSNSRLDTSVSERFTPRQTAPDLHAQSGSGGAGSVFAPVTTAPRGNQRQSDSLFDDDIMTQLSDFRLDDDEPSPEPAKVAPEPEPELAWDSAQDEEAYQADSNDSAEDETYAEANFSAVQNAPEDYDYHNSAARFDDGAGYADGNEVDPLGDLIAAQLSETNESSEAEYADGFEVEQNDTPSWDDTKGEATVTSGRDEDRFSVSPVFGLGSSEKSTARTSTPDPLDDIESLIGDAVRSGFSRSGVDTAAPRSEQPMARDEDFGGAAQAAEAAILAATASMRQTDENRISSRANFTPVQPQSRQPKSDAPRMEPGFNAGATPYASEDIDLDDEMPVSGRQRSIWQKSAAPLVAAALLVVAAVGLYWVFGFATPEGETEAPVLNAAAEPVKDTPVAEDTPANDSASVVFNTASEPSPTEALVSRDQSAAVDTSADVSRVIEPSAEDDTESGLVNRKVRTVTVRPDGTIVSGDDNLAGGQVLPVERPEVPSLPADSQTAASQLASQPILGSTPETPAATEVAAAEAVTSPVEIENTSPALTAPIPLPRPTRSNIPTAATAVTPATTPSSNTQAVDLIAGIANANTGSNTATSRPAATTTATATPTRSAGPNAYVQLASQRSVEAAQQTLVNLQSRFGTVLNGRSLEIQETDLGERGKFYRVRMPAGSTADANSACNSIKQAGGDCFVIIE